MTGDVFDAQAKLLAGRPVRCVIDVGAYVGDTPLRYVELFPAATVHALEPDRVNFAELERFTGSCPAVRRYPVAAGAADGRAVLHRNGYAPTHSLLPRPAGGKRYFPTSAGAIDSVEVEVVTLDTFCRRYAIERVDVLKLDVQGGEIDAIAGASRLLAAGQVDVICTEVAFVPHYQDQPLFPAIWASLAAHGYAPFDVRPHLYGSDGQLRYADAIFVSPAMRRDVCDRVVEP